MFGCTVWGTCCGSVEVSVVCVDVFVVLSVEVSVPRISDSGWCVTVP